MSQQKTAMGETAKEEMKETAKEDIKETIMGEMTKETVPIKAAIIGCGAIYQNHAGSIIESDKARLEAVCDIDATRLEAASRKYMCRAVADYREILDDPAINMVHICTPHYLHAPMAIEAMRKGKHVLTEKPMAISVEQAEEMIKVSGETGMRLGVCFQNRYNQMSRKILDIIRSGEAGGLKGAKGYVTWYRSEDYYRNSGWRGTWEKEGGGVLINQSIHTLDLLNWFAGGDIKSLKASVDTRRLEGVIEVEDTADAFMKTKTGAPVLFYATTGYCANSRVEMEIVCEKAVIKLDETLIIKYTDGSRKEYFEEKKPAGAKAYWGNSHSILINDFYDSVITGREFLVNGNEGIKTIKLIKAIYESSAGRKFVDTGL